MFSQKMKDWIFDNVKEEYLGDIRRDIDLFEKSLAITAPEASLEGINDLLPEVLEEMSEASSVSALQARMERFVKIEPFLRHLLGVLYPDRYRRMPKQEPGGLDFSEWTFAALLKQAFSIVPVNYNLSAKKPAGISFAYKDAYDLVYDKRNDTAHNFSIMKQKEIFQLITACLVVYLDCAGRLGPQIEEAFSKEMVSSGFSAMQYCQQIVRNRKNEMKQGFHYIDTKWKAGNHSDTQYSTVDTILNDKTHHLVKILGEAGCGKTTIMRQMEYLSAERYIKKQSKVMPIYVPLIDIEKDAMLRADIKVMLCAQLGIDVKLLENMLSVNSIRLYLDGFNEILDIKTKKLIAWSIDELSRDYPELFIFLSERSVVRSGVAVMNDALSYKLYPLDNHLKEAFLVNNSPDDGTLNMLLDYFKENPKRYESFNTPIKIIQLIEYVKVQKHIPEDFEREYIRFIFERELIEKKDENAGYLEDFACTLAIESDGGIPLKVACAALAKCKNLLGYTTPDSLKCLNLLINMGILTNEEGIIDFKFPSYRDYFWMRAFDNHLAELLGGSL